jgi:hypothetical protein
LKSKKKLEEDLNFQLYEGLRLEDFLNKKEYTFVDIDRSGTLQRIIDKETDLCVGFLAKFENSQRAVIKE